MSKENVVDKKINLSEIKSVEFRTSKGSEPFYAEIILNSSEIIHPPQKETISIFAEILQLSQPSTFE